MSKSNIDYGRNIYVGDFETLTPNTETFRRTKDTQVILWYVESIYNKENNKMGIRMIDFMEWVFNDHSKTIFFHNLSFDGDFIAKFLINEYGFTYINSGDWRENRKQSKTFSMFSSDRQIYYMEAFIRKRVNGKVKDLHIYFRCSLLLLVVSIDAIGNKINWDNYDYEPFESLESVPHDFKEYIIQDVRSITTHLKNFDEVFTRTYKLKDRIQTSTGLTKLTIGSTAFTFQRQAISQIIKFRICCLNWENTQYFRRWYLGALSTFAPHIQDIAILCDGRYYDVNSMYPYVMTFPMPIGDPLESPPNCDYLEYWEIHVISLTIKDNREPRVFKNWKNDIDLDNEIIMRYIDSGYNFDCYYMRKEFELLLKLYDIEYTVTKKWYFKSMVIFKPYVEQYYAERLKAKANKSPLEFLYKIFLNSSYGKWGQNPMLDGIYYSYQELIKGETIIIGEKPYLVEAKRQAAANLGDMNCYIVSPTTHKNTYPSIMIAATITSYARQILLQTIIDNPKKVLYFDTDSIMIDGEANGIKLDNLELGKWKLECTFSKIIVKGSKVYSLYTDDNEILKYAFSGMNKKFLKRNLNYNWFLHSTSYEVGSKLMKKRTKSGTILIATSYRQRKRGT